jgi:hypothetical protein
MTLFLFHSSTTLLVSLPRRHVSSPQIRPSEKEDGLFLIHANSGGSSTYRDVDATAIRKWIFECVKALRGASHPSPLYRHKLDLDLTSWMTVHALYDVEDSVIYGLAFQVVDQSENGVASDEWHFPASIFEPKAPSS